MTESSSADPFSTFLNHQSGHVPFGGPPTDAGELPGEAWDVLAALAKDKAVEVVELRAATKLSTMQLARLLTMLVNRGLARLVPDDEDDIAMITKAGRAALSERPPS